MLDSSRVDVTRPCMNMIFDKKREHYMSCHALDKSQFTSKGLPLKLPFMNKRTYSSVVSASLSKGSTNIEEEPWQSVRKGRKQPTRNQEPDITLRNRFSVLHKNHSQDCRTVCSNPVINFQKPCNKHILTLRTHRRFGSDRWREDQPRHMQKHNTDKLLHMRNLPYTAEKPDHMKGSSHTTEKPVHMPRPAHTTEQTSCSEHGEKQPFQKWKSLSITTVPNAQAVVYGDSIVRNVSKHAHNITTICLPGGKLYNMRRNLKDPDIQQLLKASPTIILHGGSNDAANGSTIDEIVSDLNKLIKSVKFLCPNAHIIVSGVLLRKGISVHDVKLLNSVIAEKMSIKNLTFVDPNTEFTIGVIAEAEGVDEIHLNTFCCHWLLLVLGTN